MLTQLIIIQQTSLVDYNKETHKQVVWLVNFEESKEILEP